MRFRDIPQFTSDGTYNVDIPIGYLKNVLKEYYEDYQLELNPDFQRGNVWTKIQQQRWLEFFFKGGCGANLIRFNCPSFDGRVNSMAIRPDDVLETHMVCVDGLQRLTAMQGFLDNKIKIFGCYFGEFEDKPRDVVHRLRFNVNSLQTRREVLQWYIDLNSGGTVHTKSEIDRVKGLLAQAHK